MANIFRPDEEEPIFYGVKTPGTRTSTGPASTAYQEPYIGPGFTPWEDRWDEEGPNVSGSTPGDVPEGTRPLYNKTEWANLSPAERATYEKAWGLAGGFSGGGSSGGGGTTDSYDLLGSGALFDDPSTMQFMNILTRYLDRLGQPANIPGLGEYKSALQTRMGQLSSPISVPEMEQYKAALGQLAGRSFQTNPELEAALRAISTRIGELNAPPFSALEEKGQEVQAFDQLEQDKQEARRQVMERMAARGIGAGSGVIEAAIQQSDRFFDQLRSARTNELLQYRTDVGQERKNQAVNLGVTAGGLRGGELERREQFDATRGNVLGQLAQVAQGQALLNETRADQIVDLASTLADLGFQEYGLDTQRGLQQVQLAALMPDLVERRLSLALNALNGGSTSMMPFGSTLTNLLNQSMAGRANAPRGTDYSGLFLGLGNLLTQFPWGGPK